MRQVLKTGFFDTQIFFISKFSNVDYFIYTYELLSHFFCKKKRALLTELEMGKTKAKFYIPVSDVLWHYKHIGSHDSPFLFVIFRRARPCKQITTYLINEKIWDKVMPIL